MTWMGFICISCLGPNLAVVFPNTFIQLVANDLVLLS